MTKLLLLTLLTFSALHAENIQMTPEEEEEAKKMFDPMQMAMSQATPQATPQAPQQDLMSLMNMFGGR